MKNKVASEIKDVATFDGSHSLHYELTTKLHEWSLSSGQAW